MKKITLLDAITVIASVAASERTHMATRAAARRAVQRLPKNKRAVVRLLVASSDPFYCIWRVLDGLEDTHPGGVD